MNDLTWLLAAFPIMRFLVASDTQALNGRHKTFDLLVAQWGNKQQSSVTTAIIQLTSVEYEFEV